jgi:hypothetical protein
MVRLCRAAFALSTETGTTGMVCEQTVDQRPAVLSFEVPLIRLMGDHRPRGGR